MKTIDEVAKEFGIDQNILQNWEKKGFLGDVSQINGKRAYNADQIERIKFIHQQVKEQLHKG